MSSLPAGEAKVSLARCGKEIEAILPPVLRDVLRGLPLEMWQNLEEIRLRAGRPLQVRLRDRDLWLTERGETVDDYERAYIVEPDDVACCLQMVSGFSLYAFEEEMRSGFITIPGGHRVGLTGRTVLENQQIKTLKYITGLNIRVARQVCGAATPLLPHLLDRQHMSIYHTMLFSPPRCGKTTVLRDLVRLVSSGVPEHNLPGHHVGLVDERSEIAGCYKGMPQLDVGPRTDVLDGCPKGEGMLLLLRAMSPQVLVTDEIGRRGDVAALEEVVNAGVKVIFTVHGRSLEEIMARPALQYLLGLKVIERLVQLGRSRGPGTVERVIDGKTLRVLG
ncbi:MAG: stage III sporulation protein AA [Bacillota bacterium]|uniref:stage III sporulation protein AA n=1 Tax=Desulfurispora thermophila TaxID=265470 RepID=UPI00037E9A75|nr:stage III sporulation protein AA [Desulfurispora thermophila]